MFLPKLNTDTQAPRSNLFGQSSYGFIQPKLNSNHTEDQDNEPPSTLTPPTSNTKEQEDEVVENESSKDTLENREVESESRGNRETIDDPSLSSPRNEEEESRRERKWLEDPSLHQRRGAHQEEEPRNERREHTYAKRPTKEQLLKTINRERPFGDEMDCAALAEKLARILRTQLNPKKSFKTYPKNLNKILRTYPVARFEAKRKQLEKEKKKINAQIARIISRIETGKVKGNQVKRVKSQLKKKEAELKEKKLQIEEVIRKINNPKDTKEYKTRERKNAYYCKMAAKLTQKGELKDPVVYRKGNKDFLKYQELKPAKGKMILKYREIELKRGMRVYTSEYCENNRWNGRHMVTYAGGGLFVDRIDHGEDGELRKLGRVYGRSPFFIVLSVADDYYIDSNPQKKKKKKKKKK